MTLLYFTLFVCLWTPLLKKVWTDLSEIKFYGGALGSTVKNWLNFGAHLSILRWVNEQKNPTIIETLCQEFAQDLPAPTEVEQEVMRWQEKWKNARNKPNSLTDTLNLCIEIFFPNIHTMLQLLLTLPVGSVACERSFSKVRRLKTWDRCSMGQIVSMDCV